MTLLRHDLPRPRGLIECDVVLDVGAGIRPMAWYAPAEHICVEPFAPYAERLEAAGYMVLRATALQALRSIEGPVDAVYMLDVIEHMDKPEGLHVIELAKTHARQIVVHTPHGFQPQTGDVWGLGGEFWQEHRSGWTPDDFPGWAIHLHPVDNSFTAVWTAMPPPPADTGGVMRKGL
jgi:hypothetical protein